MENSNSGTGAGDQRQVFGSRLRTLRERAGLSQTALAKRAGLDRSFYVEVENGRHSISVDRVHAIADVLGVEVHRLFTDD
ncbi:MULTISPECIES: helix-turn-helix domain-containing protein [Streptomyces]|uniref:helix-turn-helix domain-containing protein n=1 Tax=Streptomyces TaxID=1883 RepID=UPI001587B775|nr:helix-turn-helix transcriptional regulator [Streptomyces aidingensis]